MNNKPLIIGVIAVIVIVGGIALINSGRNESNQVASETEEQKMARKDDEVTADNDTEAMMMKDKPTSDAMMQKMDETMMKDIMAMQFDYSGELKDVSGGNASGTASFSFKDGTYNMLATFANLPELTNDDFYEGWVVRKSPFEFISSGKLEKANGTYSNAYSSGKDLTDYNFYVLTLEPNDGDPAPAKHIVEGTMNKVSR